MATLAPLHQSAAQQSCASVLAQGTFQTTKYRENDYFRRIIYSRFLQSTYQSSKTDKDAGFGVPVGEIVIGGDYSEETYNTKKSQIDRTYLNDVTSTREIDFALSTGDSTIVNAWKACMKNAGGGPQIRLEVLSPTEARAVVSFFSATGTRMRLTNDVDIPAGARVTNNRACLRRGTSVDAGTECIATITLPRATTTWSPAIRTQNNGSAAAYLPARVTLTRESRPYHFVQGCEQFGRGGANDGSEACRANREWRWVHHGEWNNTHVETLPDELISQGWTFDPKTASAPLVEIFRYSPSGMSWCRDARFSADTYHFSYGYYAIGRWKGNDRNAVVTCVMNPQINITRERFIPQVSPSAAVSALMAAPVNAALLTRIDP